MSPSVTACLIARDEEQDLPRCLASLAGAVDEVVVVDTGSRDRTPEVAAAAGARVLRAEWTGDFSAARNRALEAAASGWCLVLDADEELLPETAAALRPELARAEAAGLQGLSVVMRNLNPPGDLAAWYEFPLVRLFRSDPRHRYEGRIHEQITPSILRAGGRLQATTLRILHHGYARKTAQGGVDRARRNLDALRLALRDAPEDAYLLYQLGATCKALGDPAAEGHLEQALARDGAAARGHALPPDVRAAAHMKLAQLALARRDDARAGAEARRCLSLEPRNVAALQILGLASLTAGDMSAAREAFRKLLATENLAPAHRKDLEQLLQTLQGAGR